MRVMESIKVGDLVAYTDNFLDRHSRYPNDMRSAQGEVKALYYLDSGVILVDVIWNRPHLPKRVNTKYLTKSVPALA